MKTILHMVVPLLFIAISGHSEVTEDPIVDPPLPSDEMLEEYDNFNSTDRIYPSLLFDEFLVNYGDGNGTTLQGFFTSPKAASGLWKATPAVIVFHGYEGRTDFEDLEARDLALFGYVAFAVDVYGVAGNEIYNLSTASDLLSKRTTTLRRRILAAWDLVKGLSFVDDQKVACVGYSLGGLSCLDLARFNVGLKAAVSFHGKLDNYPGNESVTSTSIQAHYGADDPNANSTNVFSFISEMKKRKTDWQFTLYSNAAEGFTIPGVEKLGLANTAFNQNASRLSHAAMQSFLAEKLW